MRLNVKRLNEYASLPERATSGSAGYDLRAAIPQPLTIAPGKTGKIPLGIAAEIPAGYVGLIFARSGLGVKHGLVPANCVGVIDSDYRGEWIAFLRNHSSEPYSVQPGERVAQLVITAAAAPDVVECGQLSDTVRGGGGFGSTGK